MTPPGAVQSAACEQRSGRQLWGIWTLAEKMNVDAIGGQMAFSDTDTVILPAETGERGLGGGPSTRQTDRRTQHRSTSLGRRLGTCQLWDNPQSGVAAELGGLSQGDNPNAAA